MKDRWWMIGALIAALYACTGSIGDPSGTPPIPPGADEAVISGARRLTRTEYDDTLRHLLQDQSRSGFAKLPEDVHDPFDNDYQTQKVSPALIEAAETLAVEAAERALADPEVVADIVPCTPSGPDDNACLRSFVTSFGRRALRRPLSGQEADEMVAQFSPFSIEGDDFTIGVALAIRALLQDVEFLYRIERGTPVPGKAGVFRLDDHELATRLSYFLVGATPPDWLLDLADQQAITRAGGARAAAEKLMEDPRARLRVERFHALWLGFHQLPHSAELVDELRAESRALIDKVLFEDGADYFEIFRSEQTYLSDYLAGHYGYDPLGSAQWVSYPDERRGILSHGSVLSSFGKFADTSPTQRGIFIRTRLLCQVIPPPPPSVDTDNPPDGGTGDCKLDKYAVHNQGGCYDCHKMMDPIGLGLENYDNQGRYREHEEDKPECPIPGEGAIEGTGDFSGPAELAELLIGSGELEQCVVRQMYRFAHGRREQTADNVTLGKLSQGFADNGYDFAQLMVDLVSTESFGFRRQEEVE
jgi:hypothetical protein